MSFYGRLTQNKHTIFSLVTFVVIGVLAVPIILPHIFHGSHIFHIVLHIMGIVIAAFLTIITAIAYSKLKTKRLFFTMVAFSFFIISETFSLIDATWPFTFYIGDVSALEIGHLWLIAMLGIFTLAVFRKD